MKLIVIPDLHQAPNLHEMEAAIAREAPDQVIFLGDYFDQFGDTPGDAALMARWLAASLAQPNRIHLLGNHDLPYAWPGAYAARCPGYSAEKRDAIHAILPRETLAALPFHHWHEDVLFSHAGLSRKAIPPGLDLGDVAEWLDAEVYAARTALEMNRIHRLLQIGQARGGATGTIGGLLWCDWSEFQPINGIHQIFGHTPRSLPVSSHVEASKNWCIDTAKKTGLRHYARIEDLTVSVHRLDGSEENRPPLRAVLPEMPNSNQDQARSPSGENQTLKTHGPDQCSHFCESTRIFASSHKNIPHGPEQPRHAPYGEENQEAPISRAPAPQTGLLLHVSDLHGNRAWFDWVAKKAVDENCAVAISGNLIKADAHLGRGDLMRQVAWIREWVRAVRFPLFLCSGNHDVVVDGNGDWVRELAWPGVTVDCGVGVFAGKRIACLPYLSGPEQFLRSDVLTADIWLHHEPPVECGLSRPEGGGHKMDGGSDDLFAALAPSWNASVRWVLSGHVHNAAKWQAQCGQALCLNAAGADSAAAVPKHVIINLATGTAEMTDGAFSARLAV